MSSADIPARKVSNVQSELQAILDRVLSGRLSYSVLAAMLEDLTLLAKADLVPAECNIQHEAPYDFAWCGTHDTTFALGTTCKFNGRFEVDVLREELDKERARRVLAETKRALPDPPSGWYRFGTHSGWDSEIMPVLEFLGEDETGVPLWERPA